MEGSEAASVVSKHLNIASELKDLSDFFQLHEHTYDSAINMNILQQLFWLKGLYLNLIQSNRWGLYLNLIQNI